MVQPALDRNANIDSHALCTLLEAVVRIDTSEGVTSHRRQYSIPEFCKHAVDEQVQKWITDGVVEVAPHNTGWNTSILVVKKKDLDSNYTDYRVCADLRHINTLIIKPDAHPLPLIKDIFHMLKDSELYTSLDLRACFHKLPVYPDHKMKTSFKVDGFPQLMFHGCPFGLQQASSIAQRILSVITNIMSNKAKGKVLHFVDDLVIFTRNDLQEHAEVVLLRTCYSSAQERQR